MAFARGLTLKFSASTPAAERAELLAGLVALAPGTILMESLDAHRVRLTAMDEDAWTRLQSHALAADRDGLVRIR